MNTKNYPLEYLLRGLIFIVWNLLVYAAFVFILMEINPQEWAIETRGLFVACGFPFGFLWASFPVKIEKKTTHEKPF